uniref:Uncharacterized protein n=1 Tax=Glossina morsitans morsitans TaxID=37546 RepID=A0A1A9YUF8_GLOMM
MEISSNLCHISSGTSSGHWWFFLSPISDGNLPSPMEASGCDTSESESSFNICDSNFPSFSAQTMKYLLTCHYINSSAADTEDTEELGYNKIQISQLGQITKSRFRESTRLLRQLLLQLNQCQPLHNLSPMLPNLRGLRRIRLLPCPRQRTNERRHAWRTLSQIYDQGEPKLQRWQ